MDRPTGIIFNIQRYAIHDGPGIRTTVFLKGCPLSCTWCHNPEGLSADPEILLVADRCERCGACVEACPVPPVVGPEGRKSTDRNLCVRCGRCVEACTAGARRLVGRELSVDRVLSEVERDRPFYEETGGGVTFSGGEPLAQPEFLSACLAGCRERGIRAAVDTSGAADRQLLLEIAELTDLFLFDLKLLDENRHQKHTGVALAPILENLRALDETGARVRVRFPVIPGATDDRANIDALGRFVSSLEHTRQVHLLPLHRTAADKYARLERSWDHGEVPPSPRATLDGIGEILEGHGLEVRTGG
jgi:pyruvate formate lyase activating enzyme